MSDWAMYRELPPEHRWIFNKAELQGALPVGLKFPPGDYCVRPMVNIMGMGSGGFRRIVLTKEDFIQEPPGYCVTPWTNEYREWHMFVNDECWYSQKTVDYSNGIETMVECEPCMELPQRLRGISRYMIVERLGELIIDVSPRHMVEEMKQEVIDDYRRFDSSYEAPSYGKWGFQPLMKTVYIYGAFYLEEIPND